RQRLPPPEAMMETPFGPVRLILHGQGRLQATTYAADDSGDAPILVNGVRLTLRWRMQREGAAWRDQRDPHLDAPFHLRRFAAHPNDSASRSAYSKVRTAIPEAIARFLGERPEIEAQADRIDVNNEVHRLEEKLLFLDREAAQVRARISETLLAAASRGVSLPELHCPDCKGRGWTIRQTGGDAGVPDQVEACPCGILEDDEQAVLAARAAGYLVDPQGNVLAEPPR
ncbi:MAG TPA: hypothetical protein VLC07_03370, partial [Solirubrobacterales bacterium]|nr:hypothetical protein [Solirubrobacterales bacterium]